MTHSNSDFKKNNTQSSGELTLYEIRTILGFNALQIKDWHRAQLENKITIDELREKAYATLNQIEHHLKPQILKLREDDPYNPDSYDLHCCLMIQADTYFKIAHGKKQPRPASEYAKVLAKLKPLAPIECEFIRKPKTVFDEKLNKIILHLSTVPKAMDQATILIIEIFEGITPESQKINKYCKQIEEIYNQIKVYFEIASECENLVTLLNLGKAKSILSQLLLKDKEEIVEINCEIGFGIVDAAFHLDTEDFSVADLNNTSDSNNHAAILYREALHFFDKALDIAEKINPKLFAETLEDIIAINPTQGIVSALIVEHYSNLKKNPPKTVELSVAREELKQSPPSTTQVAKIHHPAKKEVIPKAKSPKYKSENINKKLTAFNSRKIELTSILKQFDTIIEKTSESSTLINNRFTSLQEQAIKVKYPQDLRSIQDKIILITNKTLEIKQINESLNSIRTELVSLMNPKTHLDQLEKLLTTVTQKRAVVSSIQDELNKIIAHTTSDIDNLEDKLNQFKKDLAKKQEEEFSKIMDKIEKLELEQKTLEKSDIHHVFPVDDFARLKKLHKELDSKGFQLIIKGSTAVKFGMLEYAKDEKEKSFYAAKEFGDIDLVIKTNSLAGSSMDTLQTILKNNGFTHHKLGFPYYSSFSSKPNKLSYDLQIISELYQSDNVFHFTQATLHFAGDELKLNDLNDRLKKTAMTKTFSIDLPDPRSTSIKSFFSMLIKNLDKAKDYNLKVCANTTEACSALWQENYFQEKFANNKGYSKSYSLTRSRAITARHACFLEIADLIKKGYLNHPLAKTIVTAFLNAFFRKIAYFIPEVQINQMYADLCKTKVFSPRPEEMVDLALNEILFDFIVGYTAKPIHASSLSSSSLAAASSSSSSSSLSNGSFNQAYNFHGQFKNNPGMLPTPPLNSVQQQPGKK